MRLTLLAALLFITFVLGQKPIRPTSLSALSGGDPQNPSSGQVYLFDQENYQGNNIGFATSIPKLGTFNWNDKLLSFKLGSGTKISVYGRDKYEGVHASFGSSQANIPSGLKGKNLGISSFQINPSNPPPDSPPNELYLTNSAPPPNQQNQGGGNNLSPAPPVPAPAPAPACSCRSLYSHSPSPCRPTRTTSR